MDNLDFETDELPDAGLLAADSKLSPNGQYMAKQQHIQNQSQTAALAEDMKRADAKTSAANKQQPSERMEDFIGPPISGKSKISSSEA